MGEDVRGLMAFQRRAGLVPDGKLGPETLQTIEELLDVMEEATFDTNAGLLQDITRISRDMCRETDKLNANLKHIDKHIRNMNLGVSVRVDLDGRTALIVNKEGMFVKEAGRAPVSVVHASRERRVQVANKLNSVLQEIKADAEKKLTYIQGARKLAEDQTVGGDEP